MKQRSDRINLLGEGFGSLRVIFDCGCSTQGSSMCDCETLKLVRSHRLLSGEVKYCGGKRTLPEGESRFQFILLMYKTQAKKRGHDFDLSSEEIKSLMASNCFYCGNPPSNVSKSGGTDGDFVYSGIDRVDNSIGYTVDNCVSCCHTCNLMKRGLSKDKFVSQVHKISEMFSVSSVI